MGYAQVDGRDIAKRLHRTVFGHDRRAANSRPVAVRKAYKAARRGGGVRVDGIAAHTREARLKLRGACRERARRIHLPRSAAPVNEQRAAARDYHNGSCRAQAYLVSALLDAGIHPDESGPKPTVEIIRRAVKRIRRLHSLASVSLNNMKSCPRVEQEKGHKKSTPQKCGVL